MTGVTWDWGQAGKEALDVKLRNDDFIWKPLKVDKEEGCGQAGVLGRSFW